MQTPEELVKKITQEEQSLDAKLHNLEYFMMSEDFIKVSPEQKTLLEQQHKVMTEYKLILIKRAHRINWEAGRDKAAAEIKKATEEQEGKERISDEICRACKYYNAKDDICTNRSNKDGKCWEPEEEHTGLEDRPCEECKWHGTPGCEMCVRHDRWNPKGTEESIPRNCMTCRYFTEKNSGPHCRPCEDWSKWEAK